MNWKGKEIKNIGETLSAMTDCKNRDEALDFIKAYEIYCDTPEIAHSNMGYIMGYISSPDERNRVINLFKVPHPVFGMSY